MREPEYVAARRVLLDALEALRGQLDALVLVGAQAVYLHTGEGDLALAPYTTDADIAFDPANLNDAPKIDDALLSAGFVADEQQPGVWRSSGGVSVDLMVPEAVGGRPGKRAADVGSHGSMTARNAAGLEGALVDNKTVILNALDPTDERRFELAVAGPCALLIAKLHKIWERRESPRRLENKDALDVLRILRAIPTTELANAWRMIANDPGSRDVAALAIGFLRDLFATPTSLGSVMAGRAVEPLQEPAEIVQSAAVLASDLLDALADGSRAP